MPSGLTKALIRRKLIHTITVQAPPTTSGGDWTAVPGLASVPCRVIVRSAAPGNVPDAQHATLTRHEILLLSPAVLSRKHKIVWQDTGRMLRLADGCDVSDDGFLVRIHAERFTG